MKAAPFEYVRPSSAAEAIALLAADEDARVIAGGQTLVPMMAMRLARPARLVDISRLTELSNIRIDGENIAIGAAVRQAVVERDALAAEKTPLLARALPWVGHAATRCRGTVGGSIANADPAAEIPLVLATLGGSVLARGSRGARTIAAGDFFLAPMTTALEDDEILVEARFPAWRHARVGAAFLEISARRGDFAFVAAAAQVALDASGACVACAIGVGGATHVPTRLAASDAFPGAAIEESAARKTLALEIADIDIMTDGHASPAYRRRASIELATRALLAARDDALSREPRA